MILQVDAMWQQEKMLQGPIYLMIAPPTTENRLAYYTTWPILLLPNADGQPTILAELEDLLKYAWVSTMLP